MLLKLKQRTAGVADLGGPAEGGGRLAFVCGAGSEKRGARSRERRTCWFVALGLKAENGAEFLVNFGHCGG